ncbi:hypothetical protein SERLA73DRAFT_158683 [Serpula lacrymans var. lacrymans S7.3]|uniref:F-box domain-containing protein n=1 Tax=Serpula lacrymans var. lacrymans (strain S7.3) TaxID=936435 RepID=F8PN39_SERL3|nr:hypothetical protein SERLA73DRAFT_158683 [Serpula lacrymans var. lacrymans S7.3]
MPSYLESIPLDILQHIAYMCVAETPFEPMVTILQLLLCSRTLHHSLSIQSCPELYAHLLSHLWTIYVMVLESDELNEAQLKTADISHFITELVRHRLHQDVATSGWPLENQSNAIMIWIACLSLSTEHISQLKIEERNELLSLLRPIAMVSSKYPSIALYDTYPHTAADATNPDQAMLIKTPSQSYERRGGFLEYSQQFILSSPSLVSGAVFLTFALKEASVLQVPTHLPINRAAALAAQRAGPTMEDYAVMTRSRTPLIADSFPLKFSNLQSGDASSNSDATSQPSRSSVHDEDFYRIAHPFRPLHLPVLRSYVPGSLTGRWEGTYMVSSLTLLDNATHRPPNFSTLPDFTSRHAMQCELQEHLCFPPCVPFPRSGDDFLNMPVQWDQDVHNRLDSQKGTEFCHARITQNFQYEPYSSNTSVHARRDPLDIIITGETTQEFNQAWGAFRFIGRVRLSDGWVVLRREPKHAGDEGLGTWIFEGHVLYRRALVGKWRSNRTTDHPGVEGIFSLGKRKD